MSGQSWSPDETLPFDVGGPRPNRCSGALVTHDLEGNAFTSPTRIPCEAEAMPGSGLCSTCAGRELTIRRKLQELALSAKETEASKGARRRRPEAPR